MHFLVTGAAGFLGSHLCEALVGLGHAVTGVDNFLTGDRSNLKGLFQSPLFSFTEQDVVEWVAGEGPIDGIFHMASPASPQDYLRHPIETLRVGSVGCENLLRTAKEKNCRIVVASTSEVYGDPLEHPQKETYWGNVNPVGIRSCYDEAKRYQEAICMAYHRVHGVSVGLARIFNTYGPRLRPGDGRVVPNFCVQLLRGEALTVYGTGQQTRSFCFVEDLIEGLWRLQDSNYQGAINLGNPQEIRLSQLVELLQRIARRPLATEFHPLPQDDPRRRCPDITLAQSVLDWKPKVDLEEGLRRTLGWFEESYASR